MTYQVENKVSVKAKVKSALTTAIIFVLIVATFMAGGAFLGGVVSQADEYEYYSILADEVKIFRADGTIEIMTNDSRSQVLVVQMFSTHANTAARTHQNRFADARAMNTHYFNLANTHSSDFRALSAAQRSLAGAYVAFLRFGTTISPTVFIHHMLWQGGSVFLIEISPHMLQMNPNWSHWPETTPRMFDNVPNL